MITFPTFTGIRCLMMPYIQGELKSVPKEYHSYKDIIQSTYIKKGDIGFLTIDESIATQGKPHRGDRAKYTRALHTEAGIKRGQYSWGGETTWGTKDNVTLDRNTTILLANNLDDSCAVWNKTHENTSMDGDIGHEAEMYPYEDAIFMKAGEVHKIGILTPHESLPVKQNFKRQFLRIISKGVEGVEPYFTTNPLMTA